MLDLGSGVVGRAGAGLRVRAFHRPGFGLLVSVPRSLSTGVNVIALLSTFKLQRSRWFRIGLENTFPGFFSQEFFHRFFVSGLTTAELVYLCLIVIVTITMYTISQTAFPRVGCGSWIVLYDKQRIKMAG